MAGKPEPRCETFEAQTKQGCEDADLAQHALAFCKIQSM